MPHRLRTFAVAGAALVASTLGASCSSSGSDAASSTTTPVERPSTTEAATTEDPTTTQADDGAAPSPVDCQALLQEYTERFTMDDLTDAAAFFREYAPSMPDDVAAASLRIADAYDEAEGDPANLDFGDVDLTADAQTFSDWTNDGCPAG